MKGYSEKKRSKFGFSFAFAIILLALILMAVLAYFSIEPNDGEDVISETTVTSTPRPTATSKPDFTPAPTIDVNETPEPVLEDVVPTQIPKPKVTLKPKSTPKPTSSPTKAPTPKPTEIPSDPNGTSFINKYVDSGIYIRSDAGTENNVVYHVKREEGQVRLNPTGESKLDSSGYRWYNVTTPDGQSGWVREDVVVKK